jgi:ABC-2 type transport system permease protein
MSSTKAATQHFRSPQTVIGRFVARRTLLSATFIALLFGVVVAAKAAGYADAFPTVLSRMQLAASFKTNIGLIAIFGAPNQIDTPNGFTVWNTYGVIALVGAIWAFLLATKTFRGEEDAGRWELLLAGQTTARRAVVNALIGLSASLAICFGIVTAIFTWVGRNNTVSFTIGEAAYFALASIASAAMFMVIGTVASQLMPTRRRAATLCAVIFGLCFLLRAMADISTAHWLLNVTPLGWVEQLQPIYSPQPMWFLPIGAVIVLGSATAIVLAGKRDLGASIIADKESARAHTLLLGTPLLAAVRLTRASTLSWIAGATIFAAFFGLLTKSASDAFGSSAAARQLLAHLTHSASTFGATTFLSIVFFLLMVILMLYTASAIVAVREDEALGYLDNFLVRSVSRARWLAGRLMIIGVALAIAALLATSVAWATETFQNEGVTFHTLLQAGLNAITPAALILGIGVFALGVVPRFTSVIVYSAIAWSFLVEMVSSGITLNPWLLDTSILHHVSLAPATDPNWTTNACLLGLGIVLALAGCLMFTKRDLATE